MRVADWIEQTAIQVRDEYAGPLCRVAHTPGVHRIKEQREQGLVIVKRPLTAVEIVRMTPGCLKKLPGQEVVLR